MNTTKPKRMMTDDEDYEDDDDEDYEPEDKVYDDVDYVPEKGSYKDDDYEPEDGVYDDVDYDADAREGFDFEKKILLPTAVYIVTTSITQP